ncbi:MAG: hypothetical protein PHE15_06965, partial [Dehalococcoidales bacterium]|nr:hypothetical protein [Dehalococcoidales bacterium]
MSANTGQRGKNQKGELNPNWKGGRFRTEKGYISIRMPDHPNAGKDGRIFEHILVMEKMIGRYLLPDERVHHKGTKYPIGSYEDKGDNRPDNLELVLHGKHTTLHWTGRQ